MLKGYFNMEKKKSKLLLSIFTLCLCIGAMCFGVYAATSVEYTLGGSIQYEANGVFVDIETSLYASTEDYNYAIGHRAKVMRDLDQALNYGQNTMPGTDRLAKVNSFVDSVKSTSSDVSQDSVSFESESLPIHLGSYQENQRAYVYYVIINITNYGDSDISYIVDLGNLKPYNDAGEPILYSNTIVIPLKSLGDISAKQNEQPTEYNIIISFELYDIATSIDTTFDDISITLNKGKLEEQPQFVAQKQDYTFQLNDNITDATLTGYNGNDEIIVVPSTCEIDGQTYPVTAIGENAFISQSQMTDLYIPYGITEIKTSAFELYSSYLTSIYLPDSILNLQDNAFCELYSILNIRISENATNFDSTLINGLRSIHIPASVNDVYIGEAQELTYIEVDDENQTYYDIDGVLYNDVEKTLVIYPTKSFLTSFTIPEDIVRIDVAYGWANDSSLSNVIFSDTAHTWTIYNTIYDEESDEWVANEPVHTISVEELQDSTLMATYLKDIYSYFHIYSAIWIKNVD